VSGLEEKTGLLVVVVVVAVVIILLSRKIVKVFIPLVLNVRSTCMYGPVSLNIRNDKLRTRTR
jgi:hypothetical protein